MAFSITRTEYFYTAVKDKPGESYRLLSRLAEVGINLLAFTGVPCGPFNTQLTIFPDEPARLIEAAKRASIHLDGPHLALLVQGDDELGALANIHEKLFEANVNVYASTGVADGKGSFGYLLYIRPDEFERAVTALGL